MAAYNNKIMISARCQLKSRNMIKNSKYSYGDAIDYFARILNNPQNEIKAEMEITRNLIKDTEREIQHKKIEIKNYNEHLTKLALELKREINPPKLEEIYLEESLKAINDMAKEFNCNPLEIDDYTKKESIKSHAEKCGMAREEFEKIIMANAK
ncbi:MAG: hypothetical protein Q8M06_02675 [Methanobacteriaceae archaeon]|nr:hypothetical protein [Methanobacteriaceae archaeon]